MSFGLDKSVIENFDHILAVKRIRNDLQSDFIYAPHLSAIFYKAAEELWSFLASKLRSQRFNPKLPIILEVPKANGFTRPGSILLPCERLSYQIAIDTIAPRAEKALDRSRVFSYVLLEEDPDGFMFKSRGECYREFIEKKIYYLTNKDYTHVLKADISSYFERLYQHVLINLLDGAKCSKPVVKFLQNLLLAFTQKDSHGIVQGIFPSDFLGSFYLCSLDTRYETENIPSVRYVDDFYTFYKTPRDALVNKIRLSSWLRPDGLNLNESKSDVFEVEKLVQEETEIDKMLESAKEEITTELDREDFYSSTISWDFLYEDAISDEIEVSTSMLEATIQLFSQTDVSPKIRDKIDRFCLEAFLAAKDEIAVEYVLDKFASRPHMAQRYAKYLQPFVKGNEDISKKVESIFSSADLIYEYQLHWLYALLMFSSKVKNNTVIDAIRHLQDVGRSEVVRAVSAVFIGKFGNATQRRVLRTHYQNEPSPYVRAAIIYTLRHFPKVERDTYFRAWSGHDEINPLVITAAKRMIDKS